MTVQSIVGAAYVGGVVSSGVLSVVAWITAETPVESSAATNAVAYTIAIAVLGFLGNFAKGYWDDRKDARASDLERFKAEIDAREVAAKARREAEREYTTSQMLRLRNEVDSAKAENKALREGQRTNGRAIGQVASAIEVPVEVAIPPEGTDEHPVLP